MLILKFDDQNEAFADEASAARQYESARILRELADEVEAGMTSGKIRDINGNTIGLLIVTPS